MTLRYCDGCRYNREEEKFYKGQKHCNSCVSKKKAEAERLFKVQCIMYKGGQCQVCRYKDYMEGLEFKHKDGSDEQKNISDFRGRKFDDEIRGVLNNCDLLCRNCAAQPLRRITLDPVTLIQWIKHFNLEPKPVPYKPVLEWTQEQLDQIVKIQEVLKTSTAVDTNDPGMPF